MRGSMAGGAIWTLAWKEYREARKSSSSLPAFSMMSLESLADASTKDGAKGQGQQGLFKGSAGFFWIAPPSRGAVLQEALAVAGHGCVLRKQQ